MGDLIAGQTCEPRPAPFAMYPLVCPQEALVPSFLNPTPPQLLDMPTSSPLVRRTSLPFPDDQDTSCPTLPVKSTVGRFMRRLSATTRVRLAPECHPFPSPPPSTRSCCSPPLLSITPADVVGVASLLFPHKFVLRFVSLGPPSGL